MGSRWKAGIDNELSAKNFLERVSAVLPSQSASSATPASQPTAPTTRGVLPAEPRDAPLVVARRSQTQTHAGMGTAPRSHAQPQGVVGNSIHFRSTSQVAAPRNTSQTPVSQTTRLTSNPLPPKTTTSEMATSLQAMFDQRRRQGGPVQANVRPPFLSHTPTPAGPAPLATRQTDSSPNQNSSDPKPKARARATVKLVEEVPDDISRPIQSAPQTDATVDSPLPQTRPVGKPVVPLTKQSLEFHDLQYFAKYKTLLYDPPGSPPGSRPGTPPVEYLETIKLVHGLPSLTESSRQQITPRRLSDIVSTNTQYSGSLRSSLETMDDGPVQPYQAYMQSTLPTPIERNETVSAIPLQPPQPKLEAAGAQARDSETETATVTTLRTQQPEMHGHGVHVSKLDTDSDTAEVIPLQTRQPEKQAHGIHASKLKTGLETATVLSLKTQQPQKQAHGVHDPKPETAIALPLRSQQPQKQVHNIPVPQPESAIVLSLQPEQPKKQMVAARIQEPKTATVLPLPRQQPRTKEPDLNASKWATSADELGTSTHARGRFGLSARPREDWLGTRERDIQKRINAREGATAHGNVASSDGPLGPSAATEPASSHKNASSESGKVSLSTASNGPMQTPNNKAPHGSFDNENLMPSKSMTATPTSDQRLHPEVPEFLPQNKRPLGLPAPRSLALAVLESGSPRTRPQPVAVSSTLPATMLPQVSEPVIEGVLDIMVAITPNVDPVAEPLPRKTSLKLIDFESPPTKITSKHPKPLSGLEDLDFFSTSPVSVAAANLGVNTPVNQLADMRTAKASPTPRASSSGTTRINLADPRAVALDQESEPSQIEASQNTKSVESGSPPESAIETASKPSGPAQVVPRSSVPKNSLPSSNKMSTESSTIEQSKVQRTFDLRGSVSSNVNFKREDSGSFKSSSVGVLTPVGTSGSSNIFKALATPRTPRSPTTGTIAQSISRKGRGFAAIAVPEGTLIDIGTETSPQASQLSSSTQSRHTPAQRSGTSSKEIVDKYHQVYFDASWVPEPKPEVGRSRVVKLTGLPTTLSIHMIVGLVYGGPLESIYHEPGTSHALVRFLDPNDCQAFYAQTANGIECKWDDDRLNIVWVELGKEVNRVSRQLREMIEKGNTRVIRATGLTEGWTLAKLKAFAEGDGSQKLRVEHVELSSRVDGNKTIRTAVWHFSDIVDAYVFKAELYYDPEFEQCNIQYAPDPCAEARDHRFLPN